MPLSFFILVFCLELETREGIVVQRVHLHIWPVSGHELEAIGTSDQNFNLRLFS